MIGDTFVFDSFIHLTDLSSEGLEFVVTDKSEMDFVAKLTSRQLPGRRV